jgi:hypothetical protein
MKDLREVYSLEEITQKLEEVKQELSKFEQKRQHGRAGESFDDPYKEYTRLLNNLRSRQARARRKEHFKRQDKAINKVLNIHQDEDEYGIRPVDERRYKATFKSGYIGEPVYRTYIKRMTGLNLMQMYILQERTGLKPTPVIKEAEAKADWKHRYETGDIY